jgi:inward rectifier potassium channel
MARDDANVVTPAPPRLAGDGASGPIFRGQAKDGWRDTYHQLLTMPLPVFVAVMATWYVAVNTLFGLAYVAVGGVSGLKPGDFPDAFFFSVETLSTVGYGAMAPSGLAAHLVMTAESFVGLFNLAVATGLLFARFSRPTARVMFSRNAVISDHNGVPTLTFRAANRRRNRIVEAEVSVNLLRDTSTLEGTTMRSFETLPTIRSRTPIFYLTWQIMHPIDEASPLFGETPESLAARKTEIVVVLKGLDETFAQTIHARGSYVADQVVWNSRLVDIFTRLDDGRWLIDYTHFHDIA